MPVPARRLARLVTTLLLAAGCFTLAAAPVHAQSGGSGNGSDASADSIPSENPYAGEEAVLDKGKELYQSYNCYACHGRTGGGGMGPSLVDSNWKYGRDPANVFKTIRDGRPEGMPAFSAALSEEQIWKLVAFVRSLSENGDSGP